MVRDDFWLAASRFMRDLEIRPGRGREHRSRRSFRSSPCQEGADGFRAGLWSIARKRPMISSGDQEAFWIKRFPGCPGREDHLCAAGSLCRDGQRQRPGLRPRSRRSAAPKVSALTFLEETFSASDQLPRASPSSESRPGCAESAAARERHRHQGTDEIAPGIARSIGVREPPQGLRRPDPYPRPRASPDHAHRPGRLGERESGESTERPILPARA